MTLRYNAAVLARDARTGSVVEKLLEQMLFQYGRKTGAAEIRSWRNSVPALAQELVDAGLGDVEVLLEYRLPLTSRRVDAVLAGRHPLTGRSSFVVVELKQWTRVHAWEGDPDLVEVDGMRGGPKLHPGVQVGGYCETIVDFTRSLSGDLDSVAGVAYLHNALSRQPVVDLFDRRPDQHSQIFTGADRSEFHQFLRSRLDPDVVGAPYADELLRSTVGPSKQLLALAAEEVQNREQFVLQGNQELAYKLVMHEVARAQREDTKAVVIVSGGPGSGKSVIALSLLGELARQGRSVMHATGSRSFTMTLRKVAAARNPRVRKMFKYFNQFMDADRNGLDVLILDEAHRIRETSANRYTKAEHRTGRLQLEELVAAARVPVFLLDEHQVVRPGEMGAVETIAAYARTCGLRVHEVDLPDQYRCGGSQEYVDWVVALLGLVGDGAQVRPADDRFAVTVADSPEELEQIIRTKAADGYSARITAGYCWPWSDPLPNGELTPDVRIGAWARPWNVKGDSRVGDAPPAATWATDTGGIDQVGCVYTAQGFEYDWSGVIIGPDLVWRAGQFVSQRSANRDPDFRSRKNVDDKQFDDLVRNVYKVLLTRGLVGTVIYSTDSETRAALRRLAGSPSATETDGSSLSRDYLG
ncbi:MAG: DUF2075 domain-containing protein [Jatrophihabitantaceae bacterium]